MEDFEKILSLFTGQIVLKIDREGNILKQLLNTKHEIDISGIKNVYALFSEEEEGRVKRVIDMNFDGKKKYMELNKQVGIDQFVDIEVSEYNDGLYMFIQFFQSNRLREVEYERYLEGILNLAETDTLTKTFNRHGFFERIKKMVFQSDPDKRIGIIYIDIDNLKEVNDTYGHLVGDKAILSIANILMSTVRQRDIVARLGGDEFAVVVEEVSGHKSSAYGFANRLLKEIRKQGEKYATTASMGVHIFKAKKLLTETSDVKTFEKALASEIKNADNAAYKAKAAGRNQICTSEGYNRYYKALSKASV